jgi:hypothetical protein
VLRPDRISDFECLHSGRCNKELPLYAFDLLSDDGVEMRDETLQFRKLRERSGDGIIYNAYDAGAIGRRLFEHACCWASKASCRQGAYKAGAAAPVDQGQKHEVGGHGPRKRRQLVRRIRFAAALSLSSCVDMPHWMRAGNGDRFMR